MLHSPLIVTSAVVIGNPVGEGPGWQELTIDGTFIDPTLSDRGVLRLLPGGASATNVTVQNLSIANGHALAGGGIAVHSSTTGEVRLDHLNLHSNTSAHIGGGLYITNGGSGTVAVVDSIIARNTLPDDGVDQGYGTGQGNVQKRYGAGAFIEGEGGDVLLDRVLIEHNSSDDPDAAGGGVYIAGASQVTIQNSEISYNSVGRTALSTGEFDNTAPVYDSRGDGGGIAMHLGSPPEGDGEPFHMATIVSTSIVHNWAGGEGGGLYAVGNEYRSRYTLVNSLVASNVSGRASQPPTQHVQQVGDQPQGICLSPSSELASNSTTILL